MKNLNIAFIIYELNAGGQERQMSYAFNSLIDNGIKPILFVWDGDKVTSQDFGISNYNLKIIKLKGFHLLKIFKIRSQLQIHKINILGLF